MIDLNNISDSKELDPLLEHLFSRTRRTGGSPRKVSTTSHIFEARNAGDSLPNVGAIARATVMPALSERTQLTEYQERLRLAQLQASNTGQPAPQVVPLFTGDRSCNDQAIAGRTHTRIVLACVAVLECSLLRFILARGLALVSPRSPRRLSVASAAAHLLTAIGFAALLSRADPLRDTLLFVRYAQAVIAGLGLFSLVSFVDFRKAAFLSSSYVPLIAAFLLSFLLIVFGNGPGHSNAKVNLGPFQPVEAIRLLLALFLAGYFARRWELLRQIEGGTIRGYRVPRWLHIPRLDYVMPVVVGVAASLFFFFLQKDLGPALFITCVFLAVYTIARNRNGMALAGLAILILGFYLGYALNISATLAPEFKCGCRRGTTRCAEEIKSHSPSGVCRPVVYLARGWVSETRGICPLVTRISSSPRSVRNWASSDSLNRYRLRSNRGTWIPRRPRAPRMTMGSSLHTTVTLFLDCSRPHHGCGYPWNNSAYGNCHSVLSYGGSAMLANFAGLGVRTAIRTQHARVPATGPFLKPRRHLGRGLSIAALLVLVVLFDIQVRSADAYVIKPHLSLQADGGRRYQYNQRVLDVARMIPRGTDDDRAGLPLATSSAAVALKAREDYKQAGLTFDPACMKPFERCYPLGGTTFHLLGDAATPTIWSATNSSYIERDKESMLRGFNDSATVVDSIDASGRTMRTVRRDYRELVPLLRHRYQPEHSEWQKFLSRPRDITLTIDARLQAKVAAILSKQAQICAWPRCGSGD